MVALNHLEKRLELLFGLVDDARDSGRFDCRQSRFNCEPSLSKNDSITRAGQQQRSTIPLILREIGTTSGNKPSVRSLPGTHETAVAPYLESLGAGFWLMIGTSNDWPNKSWYVIAVFPTSTNRFRPVLYFTVSMPSGGEYRTT